MSRTAPASVLEEQQAGAAARAGDEATSGISLGAAPVLAIIAAAGLLIIAVGNNHARLGEGGEALFWTGLLIIYLPLAFRLFGQSPSREERLALVVVLGMALYMVKVLHSPSGFTLHDELASWRGVWDLQRSGHLFTDNPLVGSYSVFPGMTAVTGALTSLGDLHIFLSAVLLMGLARLALMVALFLILERAGSPWIAGIAIVIYACNPSILFFDSQFGYESLALPIGAALLLLVTRGYGFDPRRPAAGAHALLGGIALITAGLVLTHHLTTYAMIAFLFLWAAVIAVLERRPPLRQMVSPPMPDWRSPASVLRAYRERLLVGPALAGLLLAAAAVVWFVFIAGGATRNELGGVFANAAKSLGQLIVGGSGSKTLFRGGTGEVDPLWIRLLGLTSVGVLALVIPLGSWRVWRSERARTMSVALAIVALLYPLTLVPRLTQAGSEISQRASEFVFVGIGFVGAVLFLHAVGPLSAARRRLVALLATGLAGLVFLGGVIIGEAAVTRVPGKFVVGAEGTSISPQGVAAAQFAADALPRNSRILVDAPNGLLLGSYGHLEPVIGSIRGIPVTHVFFAKTLDRDARTVIVHDAIDFIVVDRRLHRSLPTDGHYFERGEPGAFDRDVPISLAVLNKFGKVPGVSKIYDSGAIAIFDMRGIRGK